MLFTVLSFVLLISNVNASVNISDEDYNRLKYVFSDARISTMTEEEINKYLSYDLENTRTAHKNYEVTKNNNGYTYRELSDEDFEEAIENSNVSTYGTGYRETTYKRLQLSATPIGTNVYNIMLVAQWKVTPSVKSFDVEAIRVDDAEVINNSQDGDQIYWTASDSQYHVISYSANGTNIKKATNGFGISMNLVDDASYFENLISANVRATSKYATVYGSYQHAVKAKTLAESQLYTISHNGLGKVINFHEAIEYDYDHMGGVYLELDYTA